MGAKKDLEAECVGLSVGMCVCVTVWLHTNSRRISASIPIVTRGDIWECVKDYDSLFILLKSWWCDIFGSVDQTNSVFLHLENKDL